MRGDAVAAPVATGGSDEAMEVDGDEGKVGAEGAAVGSGEKGGEEKAGDSDSDSDSEEEGPQMAGAEEPAAEPQVVGPAMVGPAMPEGFVPKEGDEEEEEEEEAAPKSVGPALPAGISREKLEEFAERYRENAEAEDSDDEGPKQAGDYSMQRLMAYEAADVARRDGDTVPTHQEWMTVLPPEKSLTGKSADPAQMLLNGPREFSRKTITSRGDTSMWTDTPADRERNTNECRAIHQYCAITAPSRSGLPS